MRLESVGNSHRFVISNDGKAVAKKIYFSLDGRSGGNPLDPEEYGDKIPIPSLHPGNSVTLAAMLHQESAGKYGILIR